MILFALCLLAAARVFAQSVPAPDGAVQQLLEKGANAEAQSKLPEAESLYQQAWKAAQERNDAEGEAVALLRLGQAAIQSKKGEAAQAYLEKALFLSQKIGDVVNQARSLFSLGTVAAGLRQPLQAIERYNAAAPLFQSVGNKKEAAESRLKAGSLLRRSGQISKALTCDAQALTLFQDAGNDDGRMRALLEAGNCYADIQDVAPALERFEIALSLAKKNNDDRHAIMIMSNIAVVKTYRGEIRQALDVLAESVRLKEKLRDSAGEIVTLNNIALLQFRIGDVLAALTTARRALQLARSIDDWRGIATELEAIGGFYYNIRRFDDALQSCRDAVAASRKTDLRVQARNLNSLANVCEALKNLTEERAALTEALEIFRKLGDQDGEASALYSLSTCLNLSGETAQAQAAAEQARAEFHAAGDAEGEGMVLEYLGETLEQAGRSAEAMTRYQQALPLFQQSDYLLGQAETVFRVGALQETNGRLSEAEGCYSQALGIYERFRAGMGDLTQAKLRYSETLNGAYRAYLGLLLQTGQNERAFAWSQKSKSRALLDLMQAGESASPVLPLSPDAIKRHAALQQRGNALTRKWLAALGDLNAARRRAQPDEKRRRSAEARTRAIRREQQELEKEWDDWQERRILDAPRDAPQPARTFGLSELAASLPEDTALLEYAAYRTGRGAKAREGFALFVLTRRGGKPKLRVYRLPSEGAELARKARELREACASRPDSAAASLYKSLAHDLYGLLIAPAENSLAGVTRLILCPDGALWDAPFQAFLLPASATGPVKTPYSEFLWERYALVTEYSATGWKAVSASRERAHRPQPTQTLLALANPDFGTKPDWPASRDRAMKTTFDATDGNRGGGAFAALPYTQAEADSIRAAFPDAVVKTGAAAQEAYCKRFAGEYRYLHFATHALFNDAAPLLSGVALAKPTQGSPEDGILTARELLDLRLSAELIVFSACETARGANQIGEGIIGLTWATFAAGVPAQVVSQWSVDDAVTASLMGAFYRGLKQGKSKDAALRDAALGLLRDGSHSHPFYWAPFVVMGDWR